MGAREEATMFSRFQAAHDNAHDILVVVAASAFPQLFRRCPRCAWQVVLLMEAVRG
jgi:hypothetical protein